MLAGHSDQVIVAAQGIRHYAAVQQNNRNLRPIQLSNNALLCAALGLKNLKPFFTSHGQSIGFQSQTKISRDDLAKKLESATGAKPRILPGGKNICEKIGVVTGGAGGDLKIAAAGRGTGAECFLRWPLRDGNLRREGARGGACQEVQAAVGISRPSDRLVIARVIKNCEQPQPTVRAIRQLPFERRLGLAGLGRF